MVPEADLKNSSWGNWSRMYTAMRLFIQSLKQTAGPIISRLS